MESYGALGSKLLEFALVIRLGLATKFFLARGTQLRVGEAGTPALFIVLNPVPNPYGHVVGTHRCL